jgi:hypothetical protein
MNDGSTDAGVKAKPRAKDGSELEEMVEWSATGRVGVSLAGMSAQQDVNFAAARTVSRISEMCSCGYWEGSSWEQEPPPAGGGGGSRSSE